jgi:hypothetical protein
MDGWMDGWWKVEGGRRKVKEEGRKKEGRTEEWKNARMQSNVVQVQHDRKNLDAASILNGGFRFRSDNHLSADLLSPAVVAVAVVMTNGTDPHSASSPQLVVLRTSSVKVTA